MFMNTKECRRCFQRKDLSEFTKSSRNKQDGLHSWCKKCVNAARMETYYKDTSINQEAKKRLVLRNKKYVYDYLLTHSCVDCPETDIRVLHFDHVRGHKVSNVSKLVNGASSLIRVMEEVKKCDIRCANCHARKDVPRLIQW